MLPGKRISYVAEDYLAAVHVTGADAVILPLATPASLRLLDRLDGLLVTGNERPLPPHLRDRDELPGLRDQNPKRYKSDAAWLWGALGRALPILGVCRGMQMLVELRGGSLWPRLYPRGGAGQHAQDVPPDQPWHGLQVEAESRLARALGATAAAVNSFHVQGVREPGEGMLVSGRSPDGVVEAIESQAGPFVMGLQFHPEKMLRTDPRMLGIFRAFTAAAEAERS